MADTKRPLFGKRLDPVLFCTARPVASAQFMNILIKWNKVYNLTAIHSPEDIITHHFLDSLSIAPYIQGNVVLDVGSGAGFPGIPCAMFLTNKNFTLLDSNGKKTRFLTHVVCELQLKNVKVFQARIENYYSDICFDTIMARAFAKVDRTLAFTQRLLCPQGEVLIMKGIYPKAELQNLPEHVKVHELTVPGLYETRHLVCIKRLLDE